MNGLVRVTRINASIPTVKVELKSVPTRVYFESLLCERGHNRAYSEVQSSKREIFSGFSPSGSALIPQTSCHGSETAKKQIWGPLFQQLGSRPHP